MSAGVQRTAMAALCLTALLSSAQAGGEPAAGSRFELRVIVHDCYTATHVRVFVDGRRLVLVPPAQRNDSVALCYNHRASLGSRAQVRVLSGGRDRRIDLSPNAEARFLLISAAVAPSARLTRDPPLFD